MPVPCAEASSLCPLSACPRPVPGLQMLCVSRWHIWRGLLSFSFLSAPGDLIASQGHLKGSTTLTRPCENFSHPGKSPATVFSSTVHTPSNRPAFSLSFLSPLLLTPCKHHHFQTPHMRPFLPLPRVGCSRPPCPFPGALRWLLTSVPHLPLPP